MSDQKEELPLEEPLPLYPLINGDPDDDPQPKPGILARLFAAIRRTLGLKTLFELRKHRPPIIILFDHLYGQYQTVSVQIPQDAASGFIKILEAKRFERSLRWSDLYHFQLILADALPAEQLRTKIRRLRYDYRSVAGDKEFDDYMASKPPDLQSPPQPTEDQTVEQYTQLLREDVKDLLGRMYMEYAILPVREERLTELTWVAARLCLYSLLSLLILLAILFIVPMIGEMMAEKGDVFDKFNALLRSPNLSSLTVFVVVIAGAIGGFVSALRRIQSPQTGGDSLYNLSLLFHGSYSVFVAPISGAIFAIVLYLMFTSGTLMGTFFPEIYTPEGKFTSKVVLPLDTEQPKPTPPTYRISVGITARGS